MILSCYDKSVLSTYLVDWEGILAGDGLAGDGSKEVPPRQAFLEDRMTASIAALGLVARRNV